MSGDNISKAMTSEKKNPRDSIKKKKKKKRPLNAQGSLVQMPSGAKQAATRAGRDSVGPGSGSSSGGGAQAQGLPQVSRPKPDQTHSVGEGGARPLNWEIKASDIFLGGIKYCSTALPKAAWCHLGFLYILMSHGR